MIVREAIGIVIREIRKERGLTIQQLATMTNVSEFTIVLIEGGNLQLSGKELLSISNALSCHPRSIINLTDRLLNKFRG